MTSPSPASLASFRLDECVAVVTGGGSGIGRATAELFGTVGARVFVADRDLATARECVDAIVKAGGTATAVVVDVANDAAVERAFGAAAERTGRFDILVNNAGINIRKAAVEIPRADWDRVMAVNLSAVFMCARVAARHMIAGGRGGAIINTASIMALSGGGLYPNIAYQTAKGALVNMTRALAVEWAEHLIRVNAVAPTYVRTPFIEPLLARPDLMARVEAMTPLGRIAEPHEVATAMLFLASPAAATVTGHTLPVDGGFLAR